MSDFLEARLTHSCMASWRLANVGLALVLSIGAAASVQAADNVELERRLAQSLGLIESLKARVERLEQQLLASKKTEMPGAAAPAADTTATRLGDVEKGLSQLTAAGSRDLRDPGLPLHGFADVGLVAVRKPQPGQHNSFAIGSLDFYLTPELGGKVKTLVELNFGVESSGETVADIERAQIGYAFSDKLTVWLGRFHTPFGYWNMAFHHGAQIQTSILRPRMLDFEDDGGILPVHTTGAWGTGGVRLGTGKLIYNLYTGNGTRISDGQLNPNAHGDDNGNKVLGFGLNYRFGGALDGLAFGINGLRQIVEAHDAADVVTSRTRLGMLGAHAVYDNNDWEIIGEFYHLRNANLGSGAGTYGSWTGYAEIGRTFNDRWMPYYRFERASLDQRDNYFLAQSNGRSYSRHLLGVRYNADPRATVKLELNRTNDDGVGHAVNEFRAQYAISF